MIVEAIVASAVTAGAGSIGGAAASAVSAGGSICVAQGISPYLIKGAGFVSNHISGTPPSSFNKFEKGFGSTYRNPFR